MIKKVTLEELIKDLQGSVWEKGDLIRILNREGYVLREYQVKEAI